MTTVTPSPAQPASTTRAAGAPAKKRVSTRKPGRTPMAAKATRAGAAAAKTPKSTEAPKKAAVSTARPAAAPVKSERVKLVRDSFTMPKADFEMIDTLKQRALKQGREVKKSELLRAGLHALAALGDTAFGSVVAAVPRLKTGRPHQKKGK
jgi:hypothetical protein